MGRTTPAIRMSFEDLLSRMRKEYKDALLSRGRRAAFDRLVIDRVVNLVGQATKFGAFVVDLLDRLIVDDWLVMGSARATRQIGKEFAHAETGRVRQYLLFTVIGVCVIAVICMFVL